MGKSPTTPPLDETSPPEDTMSEELSADTNSRLFEFAEVRPQGKKKTCFTGGKTPPVVWADGPAK